MCARPQREEPLVPASEPPPLPSVASVSAAAAPEIGFSNSVAVRVSFLVAVLSTGLMYLIPLPPLLVILKILLVLPGGGFYAVYLYQRRTGLLLGPRRGARLGWLAGVFCFVITTVLSTIFIVILAKSVDVLNWYRELLINQGTPTESLDQMAAMLHDPAQLTFLVLFTLLFMFAFFTILPLLGGLLGANVLDKREQR